MEAALYASRSSADAIAGLRLTLGRNDPDAGLLGPLHARSALVGSVAVPGVDNISASSATGNGIALSNRPLSQPTSFDRHTPAGRPAARLGRRAVLQRRAGRLPASRAPTANTASTTCRWPIGPNEFRLVFHGPLGQLRVERQSFLLGAVGGAAGRAVLRRGGAARPAGPRARAGAGRMGPGRTPERQRRLVRMRRCRDGGEQRLCQRRAARLLARLHPERRRGPCRRWRQAGPARPQDADRQRSPCRPAGPGSTASPASCSCRPPTRCASATSCAPKAALVAGRRRWCSRCRSMSQRDLLASQQGKLAGAGPGLGLPRRHRRQQRAALAVAGRRGKVADGLLQVSRRVAGIGLTGQLQYLLAPSAQAGQRCRLRPTATWPTATWSTWAWRAPSTQRETRLTACAEQEPGQLSAWA